jgi:hypothetical protein
MGFFSNLSGGKTRRAAREAQATANRHLSSGLSAARSELAGIGDDQTDILNDYYGDAQGYIDDGFSTAEDLLRDGLGDARGDLGEGYDRAIAAEREFLTRANQYTDPFVQAGVTAQERFGDLSGINGEDAQRTAIDSYVNSPATDRRQREVARALNARGQSGGGRAYQAAARVAEDDFQNTLSRLEGAAARGQNVSQYVSGLTSGTGGRIAGYEANRGTGLAGLTQANSNALADLATRQGLTLGNLAQGQGQNLASVRGNTGSALADLAFGTAQLKANNAINTGNTVGNSYNTGFNNLIGLVGAGAGVAGAFNRIPKRSGSQQVGILN